MKGIIVVDKPSGITSFDVVRSIRSRLRIKKVGHCGTLDPLATGLLVILLGESTKLFPKFSSFDKSYEATLQLGIITATGDCQGEVLEKREIGDIPSDKLKEVFSEFEGDITQEPPMFSALKYHGKKLYELARLGIEVPRQKRAVKIIELKLINFDFPYVSFYVNCSKGTYVRSLAHDIGMRLNCGATIVKIRRVSIGPFDIKEAVSLERVNESDIRSWPC